MSKNIKKFQKKKYLKQNFKKPYFNKKKNKYFFPKKKDIYFFLGTKRPKKPLTTKYLHRNKKIKTGIFFKIPTFKTILYPFRLNFKLINEYFK
uniref:ymf100 n=1 Tax=Peronosclerospora sorghi TaxID=230839 RepID=UPI0022FD7557|nr:ymf100 [Peronosclerospora sorghi]WAU47964.1 ymf100 [Peronosclerospora sorghi]